MPNSVTVTPSTPALPLSQKFAALTRWQLSDPTPPMTAAQLSTAITALSEAMKPAAPKVFAGAMADLLKFLAAFGVATTHAQTVQMAYLDALGDLPEDLLALAIQRTKRSLDNSYRMPLPAEIRRHVASELGERRSLMTKAQHALPRAKELAKREEARRRNPAPPEAVEAALAKFRERTTSKSQPSSDATTTDPPDPNLRAAWAAEAERQEEQPQGQ